MISGDPNFKLMIPCECCGAEWYHNSLPLRFRCGPCRRYEEVYNTKLEIGENVWAKPVDTEEIENK